MSGERAPHDEHGPPQARLAPHEHPPTAVKILAAARRVVLKKGYAGLTMQAIEKESGINRSLVHYYFGSKEGLVDALVGLLFEDQAFGYSDTIMEAPAGEPRAEALLAWLGRITADARSARLLYELLPHVLRSAKLRGLVADLYAAYRQFDGECLSSGVPVDPEWLEDLGALNVAVVEGLGIQSAVDPSGFDQARAFSLWHDMVLFYVRSGQARSPEPEGR